jgi:sugar lactone lactonase YvrE
MSKRLILVPTLLALTTFTAFAALPTFWQVSTEAEFLRGEVENLSIDTYGRLTLGPTSTPAYESSAPFLWTVITAPDGSVYAGSGNEGQVYRIDPAGKGGLFFDSEELEVHAIVPAPGGGIFVATSPNGKIYKVDGAGKGAVFFDPADRYIWSLAVDRDGNVFAATGDKGIIYKITPKGTGSVFYETKATHAMALAFDRDGRLLAGTESPGRVFRIDATGKPFVILDSSYNEIRTLRVDTNGMIYAAAVSGRAGGSSAPPASAPADPTGPQPVVTVSAEVTAIALADVPVGGGQPSPPPTPRNVGPVTGAIFRIAPDGAWDLIWESREDTPYDVAFEGNGNLLVATGNKGKIYRLSGDPYQPTLVVRANAQQVTTLLPERDGRMLFATSNPGKILRLSAARAERGTYTSDVRDAQTVATWGTIKWRAQTPARTRVEISTRSGNTRTPDETWSDWAPAYQNAEGTAISSPRARYLQWRAVLIGSGSESPLLTSVSAAYLPRNMRPRVSSITIHPPGTVFQRPFPTDPEIAGFDGELPDRRNAVTAAGGSPTLGRRTYQKGLLTFVWRGEDDNRDELLYDVFYRREGETAWKLLKRAVADPILVWDTTSVPNGSYLLRVVASDAPSNSPTTALTGAMESTSFEIDNAPPQVNIASVRRDGTRLTILFDVRDDHSSVQKADYSLDGDRWQTIYPKDGIADSRVEQFELVLEGEAAARGVIIRAADALNNVASARGEAPPPAASGGR